MLKLASFAACIALINAHGQLTVPASTRHGGALEKGGSCVEGECYWFSNNVEIPGEPTLPNEFRSVQLNVTAEPQDVYHKSPWRAPGAAPVFGSGCGVAGGSSTPYNNGGFPPKGVAQGFDGKLLPEQTSVKWERGSSQEVAWAIAANHGGGYSYRLCSKKENVTEECFQKTPLKFAGNTSYIIDAKGRRTAIKMAKTTVGTYPAGSEWARDPVPGCYMCDAYEKCGAPVPPVPGTGTSKWSEQVFCDAMCDGAGASKADGSCPDGTAQFPEGAPGISGFGKVVWDWSIMDEIVIPKDIEAGEYLLGFRWDCEESTQVWQNCADITIV